MSRFTILGARGLIGSHLAATLANAGHDVFAPRRDCDLTGERLGHVLYAIGVTSDFRTRPFDTIAAHVCRLHDVLRDCRFDSLVYLSSTRVYRGRAGTVDESTDLLVNPQHTDDFYNLSKLTGESLCLTCGRPCKVVRLSNVYHAVDRSDNFLASVLRKAVTAGEVMIGAAPDSAKDYIALEDVVALLPRIALEGRQRVYNLASGANVSHGELAKRLAEVVPCQVGFAANARTSAFPQISTRRLRAEFDFEPASLLTELPALVDGYRASRELSPC